MTGLSLNTGLKALLSARTVLDTIGHNMANANTEGYSRQRVGLSNSIALPRGGQYIGSGVEIDGIRREVDQLMNRRILTQRGIHGTLDARRENLSQFESFLTGSGTNTFGGLLDDFFTAASSLSTSPSDSLTRSVFVQSAETTTERFREIGFQGDAAQREVRAQLEARVSEVNSHASEIAALNRDIGAASRQGVSPNDLLDRRDLLVERLSEVVDVTSISASDGTLSVLVSGNMLVSATRSMAMETTTDASGKTRIKLATSEGFVPVKGGSIGGLLELSSEFLPGLQQDFDDFTRQLVLATNRIHSTGVPESGSFTSLTGSNRLKDVDLDGKVTDELLSNAGLPFDVTSGSLWVNVEDFATGVVEKNRIDITSTHTTVQDLLDELNGIDGLSADVDGDDQLRIVAQFGHGFDFSARLETTPDAQGAFGGGRASLAGGIAGPFDLADLDTLTLTADPGGTATPITITFASAAFDDISAATAEEVAAFIRSDAGAVANGITASAVSGELVIQTQSTGTSADLRVDGGTALSALGFAGLTGVVVTGHVQSVDPVVKGNYEGTTDKTLTFRPSQDGSVGTTPGLTVEVYDQDDRYVTTLDVGLGYTPGSELRVLDGVTVSFGLGELSSTHGDLMALELVADSDTTDALVALGLNSFFTGSTTADISVRADILADPGLVATSASGATGDGSLMLEILEMKDRRQAEFGGASLDQRYGDIVTDLGLQVGSTTGALEANEAVLFNLELRRDQVSGVDVDEELVDLVAFEQAYSAAARYISVVSQLGEELLALL